MPDIRSLEVFYWTAQLLSFRGAAERLNTTQPAVSQRIAGLEAELGVRLFERRSSAVALSAKGRELLPFAERFLRLRTEMVAAIADPCTMSGVLRLGVSETLVHTWLMRFIERMNATYPNVDLEITVDISPNMRDALLARELDLAFLVGPIVMPSLVSHPLCTYPLAWIAAPGIDLGPEPVPLQALARLPIITYPKNTNPYVQLRELLARSGLPAPRLHSNASLSTIVRMTLERIGVCVIPPEVVRAELEAGRLRLVRTEARLPDVAFSATYAVDPTNALAEGTARLAVEVASQAVPGAGEISCADRGRSEMTIGASCATM